MHILINVWLNCEKDLVGTLKDSNVPLTRNGYIRYAAKKYEDALQVQHKDAPER